MTFYTTAGTASAPDDFIDPGFVLLRITEEVASVKVKVALVNDRAMEDIKYFYCHLRTSDPAVEIAQRLAKVMILDYDST